MGEGAGCWAQVEGSALTGRGTPLKWKHMKQKMKISIDWINS